MYAGNWLTFKNLRRPFQIGSTALFGRLGLGIFLGVVAVSTWQQFSLTFGLDPLLMLSVGLVLSIALWFGERWRPAQTKASQGSGLAYVLWCLCAWSILNPFWIDTMTTVMGHVPQTWLENSTTKLIVSLAIALGAWLIPGMLWGAVITQGAVRGNSSGGFQPPRDVMLHGLKPMLRNGTSPSILLGIACGLVLNSVVLAPWFGVYAPTIAASVLATGISLWVRRTSVTSEVQGSISPTGITPICVGMAFLIGGLAACEIRLANQLMPHGASVIFTQVAGIMAGVACGLWLVVRLRGSSDRAAWCGLSAAAVSSLLICAHPSLVDLSLWMNATLTNVTLLMSARVLVLMATTFPFGMVLAGMARSNEDRTSPRSMGFSPCNKSSSDGLQPSPKNPSPTTRGEVAWGMPFLCGMACCVYVLGGTISLFPLMTTCIALLIAASAFIRVRTSGWVISYRTAPVAACLLLMTCSLPMWRFNDDASRTAKVLFSTPAFVAYRSGWDVKQLSALDDIRMIHRQEGPSGSLTLWRGRVAELYVREAGVPRSVITKNSDIVPQFAPEVLQAVYSMVIAERPGRILLLGLSAGVPLSTCLEFPIREAVCVEGDSSLIELVKGPLARETGIDPLIDDRVTLRRVSPELALMTKEAEPFDVILSSPPSSSMTDGAAAFTQEFYTRASSRLSDRGLFCQRFECVDYGPEPLRIVLKSMRRAFRQVIGIETAAGEFLLFGANAEDVFIPGELATRLELPHVLRILARSGLDWSTLLNQPAYDHEVLREICDESRSPANSMFNGLLASQTPMEVMRWGSKQQEVQAVLTSTRLSKAPFWTEAASGQPSLLENEIQQSRRSRLVEWLGDSRVSLELLRRLNEVTTQQNLVYENPDAHWWEYRNALRKQLQDRPRTVVQQVKAIDEKPTLHPEDLRRRDYFVALGNAVRRKKPTREQIAAVEEYLQPYDPLLSYFARQEIADMLARCGEDAGREIAYRLHVIFFVPTRDSSVRNVATAIETVVNHPEAVPDDSVRFDVINGLIQTLRTRWETRQFISQTSVKKVLEDVDQSLVATEKGVTSLDEIATSAGVSDKEWQARKQVIEKLLLRPLRTYRAEVKSRQDRSQMQARALLNSIEPAQPDDARRETGLE